MATMWIKGSNNLLDIPEEFTWTRYTKINIHLSAGTYTISCGSHSSNGDDFPVIYLHNLDTDTTEKHFYLAYGYTATWSAIGGNYEFRFYSNSNYPLSEGVTATINKLRLNKGETALPYEPYQPPQKVKAVFKSKNLIPCPYDWTERTTSDGLVTFIANADGTIYIKKNGELTGTTSACWISSVRIKKAGKYSLPDYHVTSGITFFAAYYVGGKYVENKWATVEVTEEDLAKGVELGIQVACTRYLAGDMLFEPMLNYGELLPYEPYFPLTKFKAIPKSRNLLHLPYYRFDITGNNVYETNGITYTLLDDGGVYVKGTATNYAYLNLANSGVFDLGDSIFAYEGGTTGTNGNFTLSKYGSAAKDILLAFDGNNKTLWFRVSPNKTIDGIVYPMLNKGNTALLYEYPQEIWK